MSIRELKSNINNNSNNTINKNYTNFAISEKIIQNINSILEIKNIDKIIIRINNLKDNGSKVYLKHGKNISKKEAILADIIKNISTLLNQLNISRVYNNSSYIDDKSTDGVFQLNNIKQMVSLNGVDILDMNIIGAACNQWVIFIYNLLKEITNNDQDIKYTFQVNTNDAHGILYIQIGNKRFSFDSVTSCFSFEEHKNGAIKSKKKNKPEFFDSYDEFKNFSDQEMNKKNKLIYHHNGVKFKIIKKGNFLIIGYNDKPIKYINVTGLKRLTKNISKLGRTKYIGTIPKVYNIDQIKTFIKSKIKNKNNSQIDIILDNIHDEKLLQFFNLSSI